MKYIPEGMSLKEYEERYTVRHVANTVCLAYLIMLAAEVLWDYYLFAKLVALFPQMRILFYENNRTAASLLLNVIITGILFTLPFIAVLGRERVRVFTLVGFGKPKKGTFWPLLAMGYGVCLMANVAASLLNSLFDEVGLHGQDVFSEKPYGIFGVGLSVVAVCLAPAFFEEFAWRGITMGLLRRMGDGFAIFASAAFFGLMHLNLSQIPFAFFVGIVIGFAYIKSGSIWTGVAIHFANNLSATFLDYMEKPLGAKSAFLEISVMAAAMVIGIAGIYRYIKNGGDFAVNNKAMELDMKTRVKTFIFAPLTVAIIIGSIFVLVFVRGVQ